MALPEGYEAEIRPRSGLALHHGVTLVNAPGTIDADYRGEVGIILINHGQAPFVVRRGDRIAQMVVHRVCRVRLDRLRCVDSDEREATAGSAILRLLKYQLAQPLFFIYIITRFSF